MANRIRLVTGLTAFTLFVTNVARASPEHFGQSGQLVIDQRLSLAASYVGASTGSSFAASASQGLLAISPAASYFVLPNVSLGLRVSAGHGFYSREPDTRAQFTYVGVAPSVGYALPLGEHFGFWPQLGASYTKGWASGPIIFAQDNLDGTWLDFTGSAPFVWSPVEHFFVGLGPTVDWRSGLLEEEPFRDAQVTVGVNSLVGGYFSP